MNIKIIETNSKNEDFTKLIYLLDNDLAERYGDLQKQYEKSNIVDCINNVVIIYLDSLPVACGSFKAHDSSSIELKRIFVVIEHRKQGLGKLLVSKLEEIAKSKGYKCAFLETGKKQHEAINLYSSLGYSIIPNYGPYIGNTNSICMKKSL